MCSGKDKVEGKKWEKERKYKKEKDIHKKWKEKKTDKERIK